MSERIVRIKELKTIIGLSQATIYRLVAADSDFPKPYKLGVRGNGWKTSEVQNWIDNRPLKK